MHEMPEHVQRLLHYLSVDIMCRVEEVGTYETSSYARWLINPWDCFPATTASLLIMRYHRVHGLVIFMDTIGDTIGVGTLLLNYTQDTPLDFTLSPAARLNSLFVRRHHWQASVHWQTNEWFTKQVNSFNDAWRPSYFFGVALTAL